MVLNLKKWDLNQLIKDQREAYLDQWCWHGFLFCMHTLQNAIIWRKLHWLKLVALNFYIGLATTWRKLSSNVEIQGRKKLHIRSTNSPYQTITTMCASQHLQTVWSIMFSPTQKCSGTICTQHKNRGWNSGKAFLDGESVSDPKLEQDLFARFFSWIFDQPQCNSLYIFETGLQTIPYNCL